MRKLLCFLCVLVLLPVSCFAYTSDDGSPLAFDFDFGFEMDPDAFPTADHRIAQGYSELLNRTRISGSYVLAGNGTDSFDVDLNLCITDKKPAEAEFTLFGYHNYVFITSPLFGNERLMIDLAYLPTIGLKVYDYFDIPMQECAMLFPFSSESRLQNLISLWIEQFPNGESIDMQLAELLCVANRLQEIYNMDEGICEWLKSIGIRSGFYDIIDEEIYVLDDYVENNFPNGLTRTVMETGEIWMTGETIIASKITENGTESFELLLPATEQYELVTEISSKVQQAGTGKDLDLNVKIASEEETWLDLTVTGENVPDNYSFTEPFTLDIDTAGYLTEEAGLRIVGEKNGDNDLEVIFYLKNEMTGEYRQAIRLFGTTREWLEAKNPVYDYSIVYETYFQDKSIALNRLTESSLSKLLNKILYPFVKGIIPLLVQIPTISCQVILDQLDEHGVLNLLRGEMDLGM